MTGRKTGSMKKLYCKACKDGENKVDADYIVKGIYFTHYGQLATYSGGICENHYNIMMDDGASLTILEKL
jgi:hypothetical protein